MVFQSGATAAAKRRGRLQPVTREPLSAQHILKLVEETPLEDLVPDYDGASAPTATRINGSKYVATVARSGEMLMLRVWLPEGFSVPPAAARPEPDSTKVPIAAVRPANRQWTSARPPGLRTEPSESPPKLREATSAPRIPSYRPPPVAVQYPKARSVIPRRSYLPPPEASPLAKFVPADVPAAAPPALCKLLMVARAESASDVHIMSGEPVRFRCNGLLVSRGKALDDNQARALLLPLLNERNAHQFEELGYADFACEIEGAGRCRVNANKQRTGIKGCFRLIMDEPPTIEGLGLPKELRQMLDYHQGLVVVSGPSGAGKTTTLASLVALFNNERPVHIITVEDPVEIIHPIKKAIITQREVGSHTKSFHAALKGSLREDPDVIAIGELRDRETVEKALEASETGHLVFATMSTPSGATTIDRLIDMFPPDDQSQVRATLAGALKFVVSQRLVPRSDGHGQVVAVELLTGNMALWSLIRDDKLFQLPSLLQRGRAFGMIRIEDSLNQLLSAGVITEEVAKAYADDARVIGMANSASAPKSQNQERVRKGTRRNLFSKKDR